MHLACQKLQRETFLRGRAPLRLGRANYQLRNRRKFDHCKHQFHLAKWPCPVRVALQAEKLTSAYRRTSFVHAPRGAFGSTIGHYGSDLRAERATLPANKSSEPVAPMPSRNFAATRRVLVIVLISSILVPLLCMAGYGYFDYQRRIADALNIVDRLTRVAQEHALKIADLNNEIETRTLDLLGDSDDLKIRGDEGRVYSRLNAIASDYPQLAAISVFGRNGDLLASSRFFPAPQSFSRRSRGLPRGTRVRAKALLFPAAIRDGYTVGRLHDEYGSRYQRGRLPRGSVHRGKTSIFQRFLPRPNRRRPGSISRLVPSGRQHSGEASRHKCE